MAAQDASDTPRKGQYLPASVFVDFEGGGNLVYAVEVCPTCFALVDNENIDAHKGQHEVEAPPEAGGPKV